MQDEPHSDPVRGIFWMAVTGLLFVAVTALVKWLGTDIPATEAAFLRYAIGMVFMIPVVPVVIRAQLTRRQWGLFLTRGVTHTAGVALWFFAMATIPIADVTAMNYMSPIYVAIGAALFLGERMALRRILAVVAAIVGMLVILRPGSGAMGAGHLAMLFAALVFGCSYLIAKVMADETDPRVVLFMLSTWVTVGLAPLAIMNWVTPSWSQIGTLSIVAVLATTAHFTMTLAFRAAPITVTQPVSFLQLVWAVLIGALVFGEGVDPYVVTGGLIIVGSVIFLTWREAVLKRRAITPPVNATKF
ncbi:DMT family transporter [Mesobacterium pallidum]|uniref:DMT family transporter n=1 Tax=Mesobacterium pallidum TaxID=2872037 RepID=UPI001EE39B57|nr:DMT family transporter [Mesobacterium pallidum]